MKPTAIICDIDGTLAHMQGRSPYNSTTYHTDTVDEVIRSIVNHFNGLMDVIVVSGRSESGRGVTEKWLDDNDVRYSCLYMRPAGDNREDSIIKQELYDEHIKPFYKVKFVLDDRNRVVAMWRRNGLKCLQVADGNF